MGKLIHYCVTAKRKDGNVLAYTWIKASNPEDAIKGVRYVEFLKESFWDDAAPLDEWEVRDTDIGRQIPLFEKE